MSACDQGQLADRLSALFDVLARGRPQLHIDDVDGLRAKLCAAFDEHPGQPRGMELGSALGLWWSRLMADGSPGGELTRGGFVEAMAATACAQDAQGVAGWEALTGVVCAVARLADTGDGEVFWSDVKAALRLLGVGESQIRAAALRLDTRAGLVRVAELADLVRDSYACACVGERLAG